MASNAALSAFRLPMHDAALAAYRDAIANAKRANEDLP